MIGSVPTNVSAFFDAPVIAGDRAEVTFSRFLTPVRISENHPWDGSYLIWMSEAFASPKRTQVLSY